MLLIEGDKTGNNRWYEEYVPIADAIYDRHLRELDKENDLWHATTRRRWTRPAAPAAHVVSAKSYRGWLSMSSAVPATHPGGHG